MVKPYYQDRAVTIYHGNCREILPGLSKVYAVITDPPFGIGFSEYLSYKDSPVAADYMEHVMAPLWVAESLVIDGWCVVFQASKRAAEWATLFPRPWQLVAYPKTFVQILKGRGPIKATDYALVWPVGEPRTERGKGRDWCLSETSDMSARPDHPCPRPLSQMLHAVDVFSVPGDLVLDPFMGSGTTLVAAKTLGRRAIGIEIEERYCEIAAKRCAQEVLDLAP